MTRLFPRFRRFSMMTRKNYITDFTGVNKYAWKKSVDFFGKFMHVQDISGQENSNFDY